MYPYFEIQCIRCDLKNISFKKNKINIILFFRKNIPVIKTSKFLTKFKLLLSAQIIVQWYDIF